MSVTAVSTKPVRATVTVPGRADLEFTAKATGGDDASVVVLYSVMDHAAVRITDGATQPASVGRRATAVRHTLGFGWTENPTPLVFQVRGVVTEDGMPQFERVWRIRVKSTSARAVMQAMESIDTDEGFVPLPDDVATIREEVAARQSAARKRAARKRAAAKKSTAKKGATKKGATKKGATKKGATKKGATKKSAARKKTTAKKTGARKTAAKKSGAKKSGAKKSGAKKSGAKKTTARKATRAKRTGARKAATKKAPARKKSARRRAR